MFDVPLMEQYDFAKDVEQINARPLMIFNYKSSEEILKEITGKE